MSITVRDFRNNVDGAEKAERPKAPAPLLPQSNTTVATTGDERLDKLIRVLEFNIEAGEVHLNEVAHAAALALNTEQKQKMTIEYAFTQGMLSTYKALQQVPAKIIEEETPQHSA